MRWLKGAAWIIAWVVFGVGLSYVSGYVAAHRAGEDAEDLRAFVRAGIHAPPPEVADEPVPLFTCTHDPCLVR